METLRPMRTDHPPCLTYRYANFVNNAAFSKRAQNRRCFPILFELTHNRTLQPMPASGGLCLTRKSFLAFSTRPFHQTGPILARTSIS